MKLKHGEKARLARLAGISKELLNYRLGAGWTLDLALSTPPRKLGLPAAERVEALLEQIFRDGFTDCWIWPGNTNGKSGYGSVSIEGRQRLLHVVLWERVHGPVPEGLELDHICRMTRCCNPDHLEPVTHLENVRRGLKGGKTHCKRGHAFTPENTILVGPKKTGRKFRTCEQEYARRRRERVR